MPFLDFAEKYATAVKNIFQKKISPFYGLQKKKKLFFLVSYFPIDVIFFKS